MKKPLTRSDIHERQLVAQYVAGKLSDSEAAAFEDYCVAHPELTKDVALERRMSAVLAAVVTESPERFNFRASRRTWVWAAAACVLLAIGGVLMVREYSGNSVSGILAALDDVDGRQALAHIRLAEVRGAAIPNLGTDASSLMAIDLVGHFDAGARYRIALSSMDIAGNTAIASIESLRPSSQTSLRFLLDGTRIAAGDYVLTAVPDPAGRTLEFAFRKD